MDTLIYLLAFLLGALAGLILALIRGTTKDWENELNDVNITYAQTGDTPPETAVIEPGGTTNDEHR